MESIILSCFNTYQMKEITTGVENGIDVTPFLNTDYDSYQMKEIRLCIKKHTINTYRSSSSIF